MEETERARCVGRAKESTPSLLSIPHKTSTIHQPGSSPKPSIQIFYGGNWTPAPLLSQKVRMEKEQEADSSNPPITWLVSAPSVCSSTFQIRTCPTPSLTLTCPLSGLNHTQRSTHFQVQTQLTQVHGQLPMRKRPWCWERLKAKGEGGNRRWDG